MTELTSIKQHYSAVMAMGAPVESESRDISLAWGLVLAEDVHARLPIPRFTNSAMDGFAVRAADVVVGEPLPVIGDHAAGVESTASFKPGSAIRIMTGAPLPEGADSVLIVENTENSQNNMKANPPETLVPLAAPQQGENVRYAGEDIAQGATILSAGTALTPAHIGLLAAVGHGTVNVHRRVRVGVLTTGAELQAPGTAISGSKIPDSNSYMVSAMLSQQGADAERRSIFSDNTDSFRSVFDDLVEHCDMVITTGGVSAGAFDVVKAALKQRGIAFEKVAMKPGKPQGCGIVDGTPVICLPGNPLSVFVSMELFALPLLRRLQGHPQHDLAELFNTATSGAELKPKPGRTQFIPAVYTDHGVKPATSGSAGAHPQFGSLSCAELLAVVPHDAACIHVGDPIDVLKL